MSRILFALLFGSSMFCEAQLTSPYTKKMGPALIHQLSLEENRSQQLQLSFSFSNSSAFQYWSSKLNPIHKYAPALIIVCKISAISLSEVLKDTSLRFAELIRKPKEELTTGTLDLSVNKLNLAHSLFPDINGSGINVSLKEMLLDSTDVDIAGRYFNSRVAANIQSAHAAIMATELAGAGNSSSFSKGAAQGVRITSSDFTSLLPDDDAVYENYQITVQNHSYGTGIENYYGADASAFDASVYHHPTLVHVFSSGNSGFEAPSDGTYIFIPGFANITGSFKMSKNIITVGGVDSFGVVEYLSSKGPAYDGRVKPEIVAFGNDGTSGAAALVSGSAALIQQSYFESQGKLPSAAMVKAILLNSADEWNGTINYWYGYGNLNAERALYSVKKNLFMEGTVNKNQTADFPIDIPPGSSACKVTLVWTDTPAITNASKALVNDLDAVLVTPTLQSVQPWVLNSSPNIDSLQLPPTRKMDTLNNVEQITLNNPVAGTYHLRVNANKIVTDNQTFAIAYYYDGANSFNWSYPATNDVLQTTTNAIIKWETNATGFGTLEYSINEGPWTILGSNVDIQKGWFQWTVPDTPCTARMRMTIPSLSIVDTSAQFVISTLTDLSVGFNCRDSFMLQWRAAPNKNFRVYSLNDKYIEPLLITTDSLHIFNKQQFPSLFYTIVPEINGKSGLHANLTNYTTQGVDCYYKSFYATLENLATTLDASLGSLYGIHEISFEKRINTTFSKIYTAPALSDHITFADADLKKGVNSYRTAIALNNGSIIYSNIESVYYFPDRPVIIFPNPVRQQQVIHFIAQEPGIYTVTIHDLNGRLMYTGLMNDITLDKLAIPFGKGLYTVRITSEKGVAFTQKLIVY